jgi:hypothetical protein
MAIESYAREKLGLAVNKMRTNPGCIRDRLKQAFKHDLSAVMERDFTGQDLKDWKWIMSKVGRKGPTIGEDGEVMPYSGGIDNSLVGLHKETYIKIAEKLCYLADKEE